jgi:hypothetical protein
VLRSGGRLEVNAMRSVYLATVVALGLAAPAAADSTFGSPHVFVLSSDADASFRYTSLSPGGVSTTSFLLAPSLDYFIVDKVSIGGSVSLETSSTSASGTADVSTTLTLWPKGGLGIESTSSNGSSNTNLEFRVFSPVLYHPVPHVFAGIGPELDVALTGDVKATVFGLAFTLGGWL